MPVGGLIPHTTSKVPYAPRYAPSRHLCMYLGGMSREKESAGWSAGRLASWRLSSNDVHVHVHVSYGPYLLPYLLCYEGSCDFGLILVRTWDLRLHFL